MANLKSLLSWNEMWKSYKRWNGLATDVLPPLIISIIVTFGVARYNQDFNQAICTLADTAVSVLITLSAFYLAAYTLVVSFLLNNHLPNLMHCTDGEELTKGLNATFAISLMFSSIGLMVALIIQAIAQQHIPLQKFFDDVSIYHSSAELWELWINRIVYGLLLFLTLLPAWTTLFSIRDIYSIGLLSLVDDIGKQPPQA
jgi:hypothetical protein